MKQARKFEFVNLDAGSRGQDAEYRSQVRQSTMRAFRRRQRLDRVDQYQKSQEKPTDGIKRTESSESGAKARLARVPGRCKVDTTSQRTSPECLSWRRFGQDHATSFAVPLDNKKQSIEDDDSSDWIAGDCLQRLSQPSTILSPAVTDPFGTAAMPLPSEYDLLFSHFRTIIGPRMVPLPMKAAEMAWSSTWLNVALGRPTLLLATMYLCSTHLDMLYQRSPTLETLRSKSSAMTAINKAMSNTEGDVHDTLIGATLMMASSTIIHGNVKELLMHTAATKSLVISKVKAGSFDMTGVLNMAVSWHEAPSMILLAPQLLSEPTGTVWTSPIPPVPEHKRLLMPEIFERLQKLTNFRQSCFLRGGATSKEVRRFSYERFLLDHHLLSVRYNSEHTDHLPSVRLHHMCGCIAALAFSSFVLRAYGPRYPVLRGLMQDLRKTLGRLDQAITKNVAGDARVVLWALSIYGALTVEGQNAAPFIALRKHCNTMLGLRTPEDAKNVLYELAWTGKLHIENIFYYCLAAES
ncbi:MAG: hypothetical protein M1828_004172 [Chrysothrix sp. TS-e1954]|nr:MAG: hypothetical protein M1828_004172 [Chrysothrix sp. TS-e1954]